MDLGLQDKVAVVGGSSRGIGLAIARALLAEGARVALSGRDAGALEAAATDLGEAERVLAERADLTRPGEAERLVAAARERFGRVDCAVANVGTGSGATGWQAGDDEWERLTELNFTAGRRLAEAALPAMLDAGGGSLVFVSSVVGIESTPAPMAYSAAKSALLSYAANLARQVAEQGVRVNSVAPGNVLFPGGTWERKLERDPDVVNRYIEGDVPMKRFGRPEEVADVVAFLLSERASFVTGACVVADGGQVRRLAL